MELDSIQRSGYHRLRRDVSADTTFGPHYSRKRIINMVVVLVAVLSVVIAVVVIGVTVVGTYTGYSSLINYLFMKQITKRVPKDQAKVHF